LKRRKQLVASGKVPWETPLAIRKYMEKEIGAAIKKRKEVMGRMQHEVESFTPDEQQLLDQQYKAAGVDASEDALLGILGETAGEEAGAETASPSVEELEAQVMAVQSTAQEIEAALGKAQKAEDQTKAKEQA
jgi:small subunit ribosomal protein S2